jgi:hypothetical protein
VCALAAGTDFAVSRWETLATDCSETLKADHGLNELTEQLAISKYNTSKHLHE